MKLLICLLFCLSALGDTGEGLSDESKAKARLVVKKVEAEVKSGNLRSQMGAALENALMFSAAKLREEGENILAEEIEFEWRAMYRDSLFASGKNNIGDHKPLSEWLAHTYDKIESILGVEVCKLFHISDIKTLNFCIPVALDPCNREWDIYEFKRHMVNDKKYYGLYPVVTYWIAQAACGAATWGSGTFLICGPMASFAEFTMDRFTADPLATFVYHKACG